MQNASVRRRSERGYTLVEVMIALVVFSVGLLGIAGLQITSLKANHGSATRTQAVYLAYDIIDRMRANPTAAIDTKAYNIAIDATPAGGTVAGDDLVAWRNNIKNALPAGSVSPSGSVEFDAATNLFTVKIVWDDVHANLTRTTTTTSASGTTVTTQSNDVVTFSVTTQLSN
jgi:type IV pilus assembly protein PilV